MIATADTSGNYNYGNKRNLDYLGLSLQELAGPRWLNIIHPDERDGVSAAWQRAVQTGEAMIITHRLRRHDGEYRWFHVRVEPARDNNGEIMRWYGLIVDVDDRKRAEESLRARERELQQLVDTIPTLVWCVTPTGEPSYINKRLETYYGTSVDDQADVDGSKLIAALRALIHPEDASAVHRNLMHALNTGESFAMRYRNRRADGVYRWVDGRAEPLRDDSGRILQWYGVSVDIDDETRAQEALRAAQERLSRASQLANLAELSASIAHEVNQPLAAVITNSHACQRWLLADPPNLQRALVTSERIVRDAMAAAEVVGRIRALFTRTASTRAAIDLNEVIGEVGRLMTEEIASEGVLVETDLDAALPSAPADRVQMQQVLVNLIRNGIDAMKSNADTPKSLVIGSRRDGESTILVEIRDNGCGIAEPGRIFEPFFTTKEKGMGMGLAICRSILESHDGRLWAESVQPRGTVFSFTLPLHLRDVA
ncbi:MAG: PAS domain-containing protein [Rhizomicrobium sp.]